MPYTRTKPSPFADYLAVDKVHKSLVKNIKDQTRKDIESSNPYQILARLFIDLPEEYADLAPILDLLPGAIKTGQINVWLDLITYKGINDLFDSEINFLPEIFEQLNIKEPEKQTGLLDYMESSIEDRALKAGVLSAYIYFISEQALNKLILHSSKLLESAHRLSEEDPVLRYSQAMNKCSENTGKLSKEFKEEIISRLEQSIQNRCDQSSDLAELIKQYLANPDQAPVAKNKSSFFCILSNGLVEFVENLKEGYRQ